MLHFWFYVHAPAELGKTLLMLSITNKRFFDFFSFLID